MAMLEVILELSLIDSPIGIAPLAFSLTHSVNKFALIVASIVPLVSPTAIGLTILVLSLVSVPIGEDLLAFPVL